MADTTLRNRLAAFYNRCPVCTHRPRRVLLNRLTGSVEYRHNGFQFVSGDEVCPACTDELIELVEDCVGLKIHVRVDWKARVLALFT